ncbi:MAG TPA: ABC transporter substrate-binding protein [Trebonia sp.]|nr:ABC transporter substrate-binding protein [Trebonia sp.]
MTLAVLLAGAMLLAACSSGSSSSGSAAAQPASTSSASSTSGTSSTSTAAAATANDAGITATQIRIAVIADVATAVQPGLFQKSVNAVQAWASIVNANGGLAGRQIAVDVCDSKLDPNATTNCVIKACQDDFAMVGTAALALTDLSDIDTCKNAQGQAAGLPNLAGIAFPPLICDKNTWVVTGTGSYCATAKDNPQTYTLPVGDYRYYATHFQGLHGIWVYDGDVPSARITQVPGFQIGSNLGIKKDGQGFYTSSDSAPQSALTPTVQVLKRDAATFAFNGSSPYNMVQERKEAALQGVSTVKVWACNSGCYDSSFLAAGGAAVNGTYMPITNLPFYSEYKDNPSLSALISKLGGTSNLNNNALASYIAALLFQDAVTKAVANGGTLSRQTLTAALNSEHSFNAQGIIGPADVAARTPSNCDVIMEVVNGAFQRVYPTKPGTFDCNPGNVGTIKMNENG